MIKVLIGLFIGGTVGFFTAALMAAAKGEQKVKPRYSIGDRVTFAGYNDTFKTGTIVQIKGLVIKKYRVIFPWRFNTQCEWIRAKDIIRPAKEG